MQALGPRLMLGVALASALAGCTGPWSTDPPEPPDGAGQGAPWPFAFDATCDDATVGFLQDRSRVQALLPSGFVAADAAAFVDSPAPTGRGLVSVTTADCAWSSLGPGPLGEAEVAILVEAPRLRGAAVEAGAAAHVYLAAILVSSEALHARIGPWGHHVSLASVANGVARPPASAPVAITIADEAGHLLDLAAVVPAPAPQPGGFVHGWQEGPGGLLHARFDLAPRDFGEGAVVSCAVREGSRLHALLGFTSCGGQAAVAVAAAAAPYRSTWTFLPTATAES